MRVVIDEGVPRHLASALIEQGIDASRFPRKWTSLSNGVLIRACEAEGYDVLVTNDKNIAGQQSLQGKRLAVVACRTIGAARLLIGSRISRIPCDALIPASTS